MTDHLALISELLLLVILGALLFRVLWLRMEIKRQKETFEQEVRELEERRDFLEDAGDRLLELKKALELEQEKSNRLLRNILPERVIKDLQEKGESLPERYEKTAVFFADIVNFTGIVPNLEPEELLVELNDIFGTFDEIFARYNCERIKTVGDAYMAAAGLHKCEGNPCNNILMAALEARAALQERNSRADKRKWVMRFGVNAGPVIGGIVGREKYIYDIFGDTVNMASRIEHLSEAMKINVSEKVVREVDSQFDFEYRGKFLVRGRGEVELYFLNGVKEL